MGRVRVWSGERTSGVKSEDVERCVVEGQVVWWCWPRCDIYYRCQMLCIHTCHPKSNYRL